MIETFNWQVGAKIIHEDGTETSIGKIYKNGNIILQTKHPLFSKRQQFRTGKEGVGEVANDKLDWLIYLENAYMSGQ